jgi:hypothetical protein
MVSTEIKEKYFMLFIAPQNNQTVLLRDYHNGLTQKIILTEKEVVGCYEKAQHRFTKQPITNVTW